MKHKISLAVCTLFVLAAAAQAQTWHELEKAVGGLSARQVHTKAQLISRLRSSAPLRASLERPLPENLPAHTSVERYLNKSLREFFSRPGAVLTVPLPRFPQVSLEAVKIPRDLYIISDDVFIPSGSYALKMPNGDYRFSTREARLQPDLQQALDRKSDPTVAAQDGAVNGTAQNQAAPTVAAQKPPQAKQPTPQERLAQEVQAKRQKHQKTVQQRLGELKVSHWPGQREYVSSQELAQDVVRYTDSFLHFSSTPFGPVRLYPMPDRVTYLSSNGTNIRLSSRGPYAVLYEEGSKQARMINIETYRLGEPDL